MPTLSTFEQIAQLLEQEGILPFQSLVEAIAGAPVKGSWWSHPKGRLIFRTWRALEDSSFAVLTKLAEKKLTFIHRRLWPELLRVVTDRAWRRRAASALNEIARRLLAAVGRSHTPIRLDEIGKRWGFTTKDDKRVLAGSTDVHTESGRHVTVLESWRRWAPKELLVEASKLDLHHAAARLREACRECSSALDTYLPLTGGDPVRRPRRSRHRA